MKFYKWKYNFYLLILLLLIVVAGAEEKCPPACTCHESYFSELPLYRFLQDGPQPEEVPSHYHNNAMYEDTPPALENNAILRMAMCVFTSGSEPGMLLSMLSPDLQALTILQGRDSGEIALEAEHMAQLQQLEVLEIHGFYHDTSNHSDNEVPQTESETGKLVLRNDALRALTSLKYLNLQHVKLLGHPSQGNRASPAYFPLDPNSNEISANFGMHQEFRKFKGKGKKEKELALHRLVFLPPSDGEGDILPYKVYVEQQEKAGLSTFTGLTNLLFIRVYRCNLREINWEMFDGLHNLQYLSLEGNHLLFIPDFAFLGTPNLQTLSLAHNQLLSLQSTSLAGLFELEKLDLSHNNFSHLSELSLPPFPNLRLADFRQNPIESVFASTFEIMNATLILLIGGEESSLNIQPNSFLGLVNLRKLNIFNIGIANLERELLRGMPKLKELEVSGSIESLSFDAFLEVPKLEKLILKNCGISSISMDAFYALYGLLYLDLSNNLLDSLPPGLFDQQFSLKELLLQNNKLTRLPPGFFTNVPAKMIRLEGNPWHCTCAMKDWQPSAINKVKQKGTFDQCQFRYDKGSMCNLTVSMDRYVYDKRVAPRCTTPSKFKNWSVFQVLRKELRCNSKSHYKMDRKAYLKQKFEDYEKSVKPVYHGTKKIFKYYPNKDTKISKENKSSKNNSVMSTIQQTAPVHTDTNPTSEENVTSVLITKQNFTNIEPANPSENLNTDTDPSLIDLPKDLHASTNTEINSVVDPNPIDLPKENSSTDLPTNQQLVNSSVNIPTEENSVVDSITTSAPTRPTTNKPLNEAVNKTQGKMETPIPTTERNTISANHKKLPEETNLPLTSPVMSTLVTNSTSASSTSMPPSTIEVPIRKPEVISQSFSGNITSTNFPSTTTRKSNDNDPSLYSLNPFPIGKKEKKLKIDLLREIMERSESQEIHKKPGPSNSIAPSNFITGNGTPNKISKKAWKLEMERKRQEKLKRYQGQNI